MYNFSMSNKEILARNLLLINEFEKINVEFEENNIDVIILKGLSYIYSGIYRIDEREMTDVDVLVNPRDLPEITEILLKNDFIQDEKNKTTFFKTANGNLPPVIFDIKSESEIKIEKENLYSYSKFKNLKIMNLPLMFAYSIFHAITHHAFFDEKTLTDCFKIYGFAREKDRFIDEVIKISNENKISYMVLKAFKILGIKADKKRFKISLKELMLKPFTDISFKKHILLNEYIFKLFFRKPNPGGVNFWEVVKKLMLNRGNY